MQEPPHRTRPTPTPLEDLTDSVGGPVPARRDEPPRPRGIRPTGAAREAVVARLLRAYVDDRLTMEEYSERLSLAYGARTEDELADLVTDLPEPDPPPAPTPPSPPRPAPSPPRAQHEDQADNDPPSLRGRVRSLAGALAPLMVAVAFFGFSARGVPDNWALMGGTTATVADLGDDNELSVATMMGGAEIDLRGLGPGEEVTIRGATVMGGVNVLVDQNTDVRLSGLRVMGGGDVNDAIDQRTDDAPIVNVRVNTVMGGINVEADGD